jgi:peptide deformylase
MKVLTIGDKVLNLKSKRVAKIDDSVRNFCASMIGAMYENNGIGLAAPQVGVSKRIIVIDVDGAPLVMINPEIIAQSDNQVVMNEGCLSIPETYIDLKRPESISVKFRDRKGKPHHECYAGLTARVIQHEIDHLDGKLMTDYEEGVNV